MLKFKAFLLENVHGIHGEIPKFLEEFLHHISSPIENHHVPNVNEVTVYDSTTKLANKMQGGKLTRTSEFIQKGNALLGTGNLYPKIRAGFKKRFSELATEHPAVTKAKVKEAKEVALQFAQSYGYKQAPALLNQNGKTEKSTGEGVLTMGVSLAPHTAAGLSGFDVCPRASSECRANCLGTEAGGNRVYPDSALASKTWKTHFLAAHPEHFATLLDHEITKHKADAKSQGLIPGIRLNVTSDINYEQYPELFHKHSDVQFYDYTKMHNRVMKQADPSHPPNYHLSLSHTGTGHDESNDTHAINALRAGHVVAMVYHRGKNVPTPTHVENVQTGERFPIVPGDDDDNTFDRHAQIGRTPMKPGQGVVSGLMLKGVSNEDAGNFANPVDPDGIIRINRPKT